MGTHILETRSRDGLAVQVAAAWNPTFAGYSLVVARRDGLMPDGTPYLFDSDRDGPDRFPDSMEAFQSSLDRLGIELPRSMRDHLAEDRAYTRQGGLA